MRRFFVLVAGLALGSLFTAGLAMGQDPEITLEAKAPTLAELMKAKLQNSQKVLEAIALEDFEELAKHSQNLSLLTNAANWQVLQTPQYLDHSTDFRRAADALTAAAQKKNLDGAALAYVELTLKCVNCHKYVRTVRMAAADKPHASPYAKILSR